MPQKKTKVKKRSEIQVLRGEIGVYMESMDEKLDIIIEGQKALRERLDRLEVRVTKLEEQMESVLTELRLIRAELEQKVNSKEFQVLESRVAKLENQIA